MSPIKLRTVQTIVDIDPLMVVDESGSEKERHYSVFSALHTSAQRDARHVKERKRAQIPRSMWTSEASRPVTELRAVHVYIPRCLSSISWM